MRRRPKAFLACLLVLMTALCGCGAHGVHVRAVKDVVTGYSDYYFEVDNLGAQMRRQARGMTGYEDAARYTLAVRVPDYSRIDVREVDYQPPAVDYANADYDAYMEALGDSIRRSIDAGAPSGGIPAYVEAQLTVELSRESGRWTACIAPESERSLRALVDGMLAELTAELDALPEECRYVCIAGQKNALLASIIDGDSYIDAVAVTGVEALGGGEYRVSISYPEPEAVFSALGDRYADSFRSRVFGDVTCTLNPDDYGEAAALAPRADGTIRVSLDDAGNCAVKDGGVFSETFRNARASAEAAAERLVSVRWGVPKAERPEASRLLYGESSGGAHFSVTLTEDASASYIRLFRVEDSIEEDGVLQAGFYVLPNNRAFKVSFKPGTYKVVIAWGDTWYGPEYMFGPDGGYAVYEEAVYVGSGFTWSWWDIEGDWDHYGEMRSCRYDVDITK